MVENDKIVDSFWNWLIMFWYWCAYFYVL